jgi:MFS family permease
MPNPAALLPVLIPAESATALTIAHTIQLAVAPVFLLSGLGALLNLFAGRLARIIDRSRWFDQHFESFDEAKRARAVRELHLLDRRMRVVSWAIALCTASAVAVSLVVAGLFLARLTGAGFARPVAWLFIGAMVLLVAALMAFLYEVHLSSRTIRIRNELLEKRGHDRG